MKVGENCEVFVSFFVPQPACQCSKGLSRHITFGNALNFLTYKFRSLYQMIILFYTARIIYDDVANKLN